MAWPALTITSVRPERSPPLALAAARGPLWAQWLGQGHLIDTVQVSSFLPATEGAGSASLAASIVGASSFSLTRFVT